MSGSDHWNLRIMMGCAGGKMSELDVLRNKS